MAKSSVNVKRVQWQPGISGNPSSQAEQWELPRTGTKTQGWKSLNSLNSQTHKIIRFHTLSAVLDIVYLLYMLYYVMLQHKNAATHVLVSTAMV